MAVKRQFSGYSGIRFDIPFQRSIESAASYDFDSTLRGLVTGVGLPYLIRGFNLVIPTSAIAANSLQVEVSDSAILHSSAAESGTILTVDPGIANDILNSTNPNVIGSFQNNAINYVSLAYIREVDPSTVDQTAGWSQSEKVEFQQTVAIGQLLQYQYVISTNGYSTNLPLWAISVSATGAFQWATKGVPSLFRLGTGGAVPNPYNSFDWGNLSNPENPSNPRQEWVNENFNLTPNPVTVVPGNPAEAFNFGDFAITSLKQWMDAIMTRFKEITGSQYWYLDNSLPANPASLFNVWYDSVGSVLTGAGNLSYNLILESTPLTYGEYQDSATDFEILPGDSYVTGVTSGNKATLQAYNLDNLIINSPLKSGWTFGEVLQNRRQYRLNLSKFSMLGLYDNSYLNGYAVRTPLNGSPSPVAITSWSFTTGSGVGLPNGGALIDVVFSANHGMNVGDYVAFSGLTASTNAPNGVFMVKQVISATELQYTVSAIPTGSPGVTSAQGYEDLQPSSSFSPRLPYLPQWNVTAWSYTGTSITLTAPGHSLSTGANLVVFGLTATTNAPNGRYLNVTVNSDNTITFTAANAPTGTAGVGSRCQIQLDSTTQPFTVSGAAPNTFDITNAQALFASDTDVEYPIGPDSLPLPGPASGAILFDGVVALATVADPAQVSEIQYTTDAPAAWSNATTYAINAIVLYSGVVYISLVGSNINNEPDTSPIDWAAITTTPAIVISTVDPHGYSNIAGPISFTIYGDTALSEFITTYANVSLLNISSKVFALTGTGIDEFSSVPPYINGGTDQTYARYPDNPYPGPIQWSSDMYVKAIIGDRYVRIPATATVDPACPAYATANQFNVNGQTGTAYLEDGQVAYIVQQRNQLVSSGASFTTAGGSAFISGPATPTDPTGNNLRFGDFVRFQNENESNWCRISTQGYPSYVEGDTLPNGATSFYVIADNGQPPSLQERPPNTGSLVFCRGTYSLIEVAPYWEVPVTPDIYWIAVRRDNGSTTSKVYFRALDLEAGQVGTINGDDDSNLLIYTGAGNQGAINPNYTQIDQTGDWQGSQAVQVGPNNADVDILTRQVTFVAAPALGFQEGDTVQQTIGSTTYTYQISEVLTSRTVIFNEDVSTIATSASMTYNRVDKNILDTDNLTLAIRKEDRSLAQVNTALTRPVYDESVYLQLVSLSGSGTIESGSFVYTGTQSNPTALAYVLHGNVNVVEEIEDSAITMPGGKFGANAILVHFFSGSFNDGDLLYQNGSSTGMNVTNPSNPPFPSPAIAGSLMVEMVLPPNRRTQVTGSGGYIVWPTNATYKASQVSNLCGEELMVIINDSIRQANVDYSETFGGPKGKVQMIRDLPANTRMRFRVMPAYGSAIAQTAGSISLQLAYNGGSMINILIGNPVTISVGDGSNGLLIQNGSIAVNGVVGGNTVGGFLPSADKAANLGSSSLRINQAWVAQQFIKTNSGFTGSQLSTYTAAQTTTNTSPTSVSQSNLTIPANFACRMKLTAVARRSDGVTTGGASFSLEGTFYNEGSGTMAAGSPEATIIGYYGEGSGYALAFGISGNDVVAVAYGSSGVVEWACSIEYQMVSLPS